MSPVRTAIVPGSPSSASLALVIRFITTWRSWVWSPCTEGRSSCSAGWIVAFLLIDASTSLLMSRTRTVMSSCSTTKRPLPE